MDFKELGKKLTFYRKLKYGDLGIKQVAPILGIKYSYLSKLENGLQRPSIKVLNQIVYKYEVEAEEKMKLFALAGYIRGGVINVDEKNVSNKEQVIQNPLNVNVNPVQTPVLYVDNVNIKANNFGFVMDFSQQLGPTNQFTIVSRVGMSREHMEILIARLTEILNKRKLQVNTSRQENTN